MVIEPLILWRSKNSKVKMQKYNFKIKSYLGFFLICLVFLITRLVKITEIPGSLYWDEASIGYNAHAVLTTGRDEWGELLPLHFRAFGEFKLPVYIYSVALGEAVFGYGELAVRLPAVVYSLGSLLMIYFIVKKLGNNSSALWAMLFFTLSPWGLLITRVGYEVTAGTMFFLLAWFFYLKSSENSKYFFLSAIAHVFAIYSYNSFRIISPLFFVFSLLFFVKKQNILIILVSVTIMLVSFYPIYKLYRYDAGGARMATVSLQGSLPTRALQFSKNYFSHFSPKFLFTYGDTNSRSNFPGYGLISLFSIPVVLVGLILATKKRSTALFVLLLAPVAASLTYESPHALRAFLMFPALAVLFGLGARNWFIVVIAAVFMLLQFENYTYNFYQQYNNLYSKDWQLPYKQLFTSQEIVKKLVVSDEYAQPYIFALYYQKYDPVKFRETVIYNPVNDWGFSTVKSFDNFVFIKK